MKTASIECSLIAQDCGELIVELYSLQAYNSCLLEMLC